jgi:O-antigen ligase
MNPAGTFRALTSHRVAPVAVLGATSLLFLLPFVWTEHRFPQGALDSEIVAGLCLGLAALSCALLPRADVRLAWPGPFLMLSLAGVGLLHYALGDLAYGVLAGRMGILLAATLIAYVLGRQIVASGLRGHAFDVITLAAIAGACYSALVQWFQLFDIEWLPARIALVANDPQFRLRPFGNIAQANHLLTYLGIGSLAALYWQGKAQSKARMILVAAVLVAIASGLAITGSRMGAIYLAVALALTFVTNGLRPEGRRARVTLALALLAGYAAGIIATRSVELGQDVVARFGEGSLPIRYELWRQALIIIRHHPLLGLGVGQFAGEQLWLAALGPFTLPSNNCHNLLLQVGAEWGIPVALVLTLFLVHWLVRDVRERLRDAGSAFAMAGFAFLIIHSMLEYPLWHVYFAVVAAMFVALAEPEHGMLPPFKMQRIWSLAGIATICIAAIIRFDYDAIAEAGVPLFLQQKQLRQLEPADAIAIEAVGYSTLFRPEAERLLLELRHPPDEKTDEPLHRIEREMRYIDGPEVIAYYIVGLAKAGRSREALPYVSRMAALCGSQKTGYPSLRDWVLDQTRDLGSETAALRHALREQRWVRPDTLTEKKSA